MTDKPNTAPRGATVSSWKQSVLPLDSTLHAAAKNLNDSGLQIALVVAPDGAFVGTITDGDIRRGLLRGLELKSPIESVIRREAMVAYPEMPTDLILRLMQTNQIGALPIIDDKRKLVGLHLLNDLLAPTRKDNVMVIMAGGQGKRLRPYTENCPKPLLPVHGKPMLEHIIERARGEGFHRFVISVHYLGHMIEEHFGDGRRWNVEIEYLHEDAPLGTAGALGLLKPRPGSAFIVTNGDVLTDIRYSELLNFHLRSDAAATMAVRQHEWQHPFGVVFTKGIEITGFEEKPISRTHVNAGIYALEPTTLDVLNAGEHCDMPTLFARLKDKAARTIVYPMHEAWVDFGRPDDYEKPQFQFGQ
jgi:dTDP-glucose pyrophosphorylase